MLVVAGSERYPGAAALAARGALRAGAGYVACAGPVLDAEIVRVAWDATPAGGAAPCAPATQGAAPTRCSSDRGSTSTTRPSRRCWTPGRAVPTVLDGGALRPGLTPCCAPTDARS